MLDWYKELIRLRKSFDCLQEFDKRNIKADVINETALALFRHKEEGGESVVCLFNLSEGHVEYKPGGKQLAEKLLDSKEDRWKYNSDQKTGTSQVSDGNAIRLMPLSVVVYRLRDN